MQLALPFKPFDPKALKQRRKAAVQFLGMALFRDRVHGAKLASRVLADMPMAARPRVYRAEWQAGTPEKNPMNARNRIFVILECFFLISLGWYFFTANRSEDLQLIGTIDANEVIVSSRIGRPDYRSSQWTRVTPFRRASSSQPSRATIWPPPAMQPRQLPPASTTVAAGQGHRTSTWGQHGEPGSQCQKHRCMRTGHPRPGTGTVRASKMPIPRAPSRSQRRAC